MSNILDVSPSLRPTVDTVEVTFHRSVDAKHRRPWVAQVGKMRVRGSILGSAVGDDLPHDLVTFVVERELALTDGFFGTVAAGGTFRSMAKKRHRDGKAAIARNRPALDRAERIVHEHWDAWREGRPTPCAAAFERVQADWRAGPPGTDLTLSWDLVVSGPPKKRRR
jgi:hypothetical protein